MDIKIGPAIADDLIYIDSLQKKNAEELSFYPRLVFEREIINQRILLARVNNEPAGYLYHGALAATLRIHQACIQYDLRGQLYGAALVNWLVALGRAAFSLKISLRCGSDIEANRFWKKMGFSCVAVTQGGVRRLRDINTWQLPLQPMLIPLAAKTPSDRPVDDSLWRRNKGEKKSQFMRGERLAQYRAALESKEQK